LVVGVAEPVPSRCAHAAARVMSADKIAVVALVATLMFALAMLLLARGAML